MKNKLTSWVCSPVGILALGALLRIAFLLTKRGQPAFADTAEYEAVAMQMLGLADSAGSPRAPAYPALMALGYKLGGVHNYTAVRWLQFPIGVLLIELVRRIGEHVGGRRVGLLAALLTAIAPTLIFTSSMLYPTSLYTLCVAGMTYAALRLSARGRAVHAFELGLWAMLGLLTEAVILAPLVALGAWFIWQSRRNAAVLLRSAGVFAATVLLVMVPMRSMDRAHAGKSQSFVAKSQFVLHYARTDSTVGQHRWIELPAGESDAALPVRDFLRHELNLLQHQPVAYVHDVAFEFAHFFAPMPDRIQTRNQYNRPWVLWLGALYFTPVLVLALLGLAIGPAPPAQRIALALVVVGTAGFYAFFFSQARYRIPVEPQMLVLAVLGLIAVLKAKLPRLLED